MRGNDTDITRRRPPPTMTDSRGNGRAITARGYTHVRVDGARAIIREDAVDFVRSAILETGSLYRYAAGHPHAEALEGRGRLYLIPGPSAMRWVVRRLSHGGVLAPLTRDLFLPFGTPRSFNELQLAAGLRELGIPTPEVTAAVTYPSGLMYRADVARIEIPEARDLADCLFGEPRLDAETRLSTLTSAGRLLRSLLRVGLVHPDLNLRNILVEMTKGGPITHVIDLEKSRLVSQPSDAQARRMLERLQRSARKFAAQTGRPLGPEDWEAFHRGYREGEDDDGS